MNKFLGFIAGPWGVIIGKGLMIMTLMTMIYVAIAQYNAHIAEGQQMRDQNAQLTQLVKDNQSLQKKLDTLSDVNKIIAEDTKRKNDVVEKKHHDVTTYITSPEAQASNRPSSNVIKNTIRMLKDD